MNSIRDRIKAAIFAFKNPYSIRADFRVSPIVNPAWNTGLELISVDSWDRVGLGSKISIAGSAGLFTVKRIVIEVFKNENSEV